MASQQSYGLGIVIFCVILLISAAHGHRGRYQPYQPSQECNRDDINGVRQCCKLPTVFNSSLVDSCTYVAPVYGQWGRGKRHANGGGRRMRHFTCASECIFKGQGISTNTSAGVNITKLKEQMYAASNANWKPIVNLTIDSCWGNLTNVSSSIPPAGTGECTSKSDMLLQCIRRNLTMNCPAAEKTTSATNPECISRCRNLRSCDPYARAKNYRNRG